MKFEFGLATIPLIDGTTISILSLERNDYVASHMAYALFRPNWPTVRAGEDTYEVALVLSEGGGCAGEIDDLAQYETEDHANGDEWHTYGYVPMSMIESYANKIGVKE